MNSDKDSLYSIIEPEESDGHTIWLGILAVILVVAILLIVTK